MSINCKKCGGLLETEESFVVCTECGDVTKEFQRLTHSNEYPPAQVFLNPGIKNNSKKRKSLVLQDQHGLMDQDTSNILSSAATRLNLHNYVDEMIGIWNDYTKMVKVKSIKQSKGIRAGALLYIVTKRHAKGIHLHQICEQVGESQFKIVPLTKKIMAALEIKEDDGCRDLNIFVEKACQPYVSIYSTEEIKGIKKLVMDMISMTDKSSIKDGRRPSAIIAACLYMTLYFYKAPKLLKPKINNICSNLQCTPATTKLRIKEIESNLLAYVKGKDHLSFINIENLYPNLGIIVKDFLLQNEENENYIKYLEDGEKNNKYIMGDEDYDDEESSNDGLDSDGEHVSKKLKVINTSPTITMVLPPPNTNLGVFDEFLPKPMPSVQFFLNREQFVNCYIRDYQEDYKCICNLPRSFINSTYKKLVSRLKIIKCKYLLTQEEKVGPNPIFQFTEKEKVFFENYNCFLANEQAPSAQAEEELIKKLLLKGISDRDLISDGWRDGNLLEMKKIASNHPNLNNPELDDSDIPSNELNKYIKSPKEIEQLKEIISKSQIHELNNTYTSLIQRGK